MIGSTASRKGLTMVARLSDCPVMPVSAVAALTKRGFRVPELGWWSKDRIPQAFWYIQERIQKDISVPFPSCALDWLVHSHSYHLLSADLRLNGSRSVKAVSTAKAKKES